MEHVKRHGVKLGLYDTQWMNCVNDPQVLAWDTSKEDAVNQAVAMAEKYCIENAKKAIAAAEQAQQAQPVAWEVLNGVVSHDVYCSKADAEEVALDMQKAHDLSGSFAAFNVRPLYAQPPAVAVPDGYALVKTPITAEMHRATIKVLCRATGNDGLPQRMLNAMLAALEQPK